MSLLHQFVNHKNGIYRVRAELVTSAIREIDPEISEHPRHADITGWITPPREVGSEEAIQEMREKNSTGARD